MKGKFSETCGLRVKKDCGVSSRAGWGYPLPTPPFAPSAQTAGQTQLEANGWPSVTDTIERRLIYGSSLDHLEASTEAKKCAPNFFGGTPSWSRHGAFLILRRMDEDGALILMLSMLTWDASETSVAARESCSCQAEAETRGNSLAKNRCRKIRFFVCGVARIRDDARI